MENEESDTDINQLKLDFLDYCNSLTYEEALEIKPILDYKVHDLWLKENR